MTAAGLLILVACVLVTLKLAVKNSLLGNVLSETSSLMGLGIIFQHFVRDDMCIHFVVSSNR